MGRGGRSGGRLCRARRRREFQRGQVGVQRVVDVSRPPRHAKEVAVVKDHHALVLGQVYVELDHVHAARRGVAEGEQGVFRRCLAAAAVGDGADGPPRERAAAAVGGRPRGRRGGGREPGPEQGGLPEEEAGEAVVEEGGRGSKGGPHFNVPQV